MRKWFFTICIVCTIIGRAQNKSIQNALEKFDYDGAIQLITKEKKTPELDFLKAKCYKNIGKQENAIELLEPIVHDNPENITAVNELADCYQQTGDFSRSRMFYFLALQSAPGNRFFQLNYMNSVYRLKDWYSTIKMARTILDIDSLPALYTVLGDCFVQISKQDSAIFYYKKAIDKNPLDYLSLCKLSKIYLQEGLSADLISSTERFMQRDSTVRQINQYNGIGYCMNQEYNKAIYCLNGLFQDGDSSFLTNYYLGISYLATKDHISAYNHLGMAYAKDSSNLNLIPYFGKAAIASGHQKTGIKVLNRGLSILIPKDSVLSDYYYTISLAHNNLGNTQEEIKYLNLTYTSNPQYTLPLYMIARIYDYRLNNTTEALSHYNLFLSTLKNDSIDTSSAVYYKLAETRVGEIKAGFGSKKKR